MTNATWLRTQGVVVGEFGERVADVCSRVYQGIHNMPRTAYLGQKATWAGSYVAFSAYGELATFDMNGLTRLVVAAHDAQMRVSLTGAAYGYLSVQFHPRKYRPTDTPDDYDGKPLLHHMHPTMEEGTEMVRQNVYRLPDVWYRGKDRE